MKVAVIHNKDHTGVINVFGIQNRENYNPKTVDAVAAALEKGGHNVRVIDGNMDVIEALKDFMPRVMTGERPGMVFNMAYGIQGESRYTHLPAMLEMLGVPYVGSGPTGHALALDKVIAKVLFQRYDVSTPRYWVFSKPGEIHSDIIYPVIVKPKNEAVSYGLKVVHGEEELREAVMHVTEEFQQQALVEEFVRGQEFAVGLLGNGDPEVLPIVEIDFGGDDMAIQTAEHKLHHPLQKICPAEISRELEDNLKRIAKDAFRALGLQDFARVDFRVDRNDNIFVLEVNSMASLGRTGSYVHAARVAGYDFDRLVNRMLDIAAVRYFGERAASGLFSLDSQFQGRSVPVHVRVRGYLRGHVSNIENMTRELVDMNSYVRNIEGVNSCGNWIAERMRQLGFHRQVYPQVEVGNILLFSNHTYSQSDVLLLCHLDTPYQYKDHASYREVGNRLYGSGIAENKGGLAVMLGALQALRFARVLKNIRCSVLLTTDDWLQGRFSKRLVESISEQASNVLGLKQGGLNGAVVSSRSGASSYQIEFIPSKGRREDMSSKIITDLCKRVFAWQKLSNEEEGVIVGVTSIEVGTMFGKAPDHGRVTLSARFNERAKGMKTDGAIRHIAERHGSSRLQVTGGTKRPPMVFTESCQELYSMACEVARKLEIPITSEHRWNSSDVGFVPEEKPILDGLGPVGGGNYSPNEYIIRSSLIDRASLLAVLIHECYNKRAKK